MLLLTNTAAQTLQPGQALTFDRVLLQTGNGECWRGTNGRIPTTTVHMKAGRGLYAIAFSGNIGAVAAGPAQLSIQVNGGTLPETTMLSQTAAAGDLNNVATSTRVINGSCCGDFISVVNTGTDDITVGANTAIIVERRA